MVVEPLKSNIQISIIIISLLALLAWMATFAFVSIDVPIANYKEHILYYHLFSAGISFAIRQIITLFIIVFGAIFVNFLSIEQEITSKTNYLPAFLYILIAFSATTKVSIEPLLVANLVILPSLYFLINSYRQSLALPDCFKAGFFIGLASFFCIDYIVLFPLNFLALMILRSFNWREWVMMILGLMTPLYIDICINYLATGNAFEVFDTMNEAINSIQRPVFSIYYLAFMVVMILVFLLALLRYLNKGFGSKVKTQKAKYVLLWMCSLCLFMVFFEQTTDMLLLPCIIPLSIFVGDYLAEMKELKKANALLVLFIIGFSIIHLHALGII